MFCLRANWLRNEANKLDYDGYIEQFWGKIKSKAKIKRVAVNIKNVKAQIHRFLTN